MIASRIGISPDFFVKSFSHLSGFSESSFDGLIIFPANNNPQVDAFTSRLSALFI